MRGHIPEVDTPFEDFRSEALRCYDGTLARVAGIHQVKLGCSNTLSLLRLSRQQTLLLLL